MQRLISFLIVTIGTTVLLTTILPSSAQMRLTEQSRVTINGIGAVQVGMTVAEAERAAGISLQVQYPRKPNASCYYMVPSRGVRGVGLMVINPREGQPDKQQDRIARVDIGRNSPVMTISGAKVGDPEVRIKTLYPNIQVTPHNHVSGGHYLTLVPQDEGDRAYRLVFETDGRRVTHFRAGKLPEVEYAQGCP
jgi:hypothetical protein